MLRAHAIPPYINRNLTYITDILKLNMYDCMHIQKPLGVPVPLYAKENGFGYTESEKEQSKIDLYI